ncbi:MAG: hypothetical protein H7A55_20095 [Verrucomicrobiaceae bacterium]|nr:hypothetical protein [Verrucomicrobiaceae bacterium]
MKTRLALAMVAVLLLGAAGLDFAGKDSHIARWLSKVTPAAAPPPEAPSTAAEPTPAESKQHAQWLAESKAIWAEAMKLDRELVGRNSPSFQDLTSVPAEKLAALAQRYVAKLNRQDKHREG